MPLDAEARLVLKGVDDNATNTIRKARGEVEGLDAATKNSTASTVRSNVAFLAQAQALNQVSGGYNQIVTSLTGLNWLTDEQSKLLQQAGMYMRLFVGAGQMIQGVIGLVNALRASETALAVVQAFKTALIPGIGIVIVGAAVAAAAAIGAKLAGWYQTSPGQSRVIKETGPAIVHRGEVIGRPSVSGSQVNVNITTKSINLGTYLDRYLLSKEISRAVRA
jgi:hypothetical protein